jgi:prophage antirepressor-like protein
VAIFVWRKEKMNELVLITKQFGDTDIHAIRWKEKPCWIATEIAEAARLKNPRTAVYKFLKEESYLKEGIDFDTLREGDLEDLKQLVSFKDTSSKIPSLTLFYETALTAFIGTRRNKVGKRLRQWIYTEVLPAIRETGYYDINEANAGDLREFVEREKQIGLSKEIAALLVPLYGQNAITMYHLLTAKGFTGRKPNEIVALAKANGVPSKVYKRGAREVLRYWFPHIPPCMALQDQLIAKDNLMPKPAHDIARLAMPLFKKMAEVGMLDKSSIAYSPQRVIPDVMKPPMDEPQVYALPPNPFENRKTLKIADAAS